MSEEKIPENVEHVHPNPADARAESDAQQYVETHENKAKEGRSE